MPHAPQPCAYCRKNASTEAVFPFCSERCKMADLGQWLTGGYRLSGAPHDPLESQDDESDPDSTSQERPS